MAQVKMEEVKQEIRTQLEEVKTRLRKTETEGRPSKFLQGEVNGLQQVLKFILIQERRKTPRIPKSLRG